LVVDERHKETLFPFPMNLFDYIILILFPVAGGLAAYQLRQIKAEYLNLLLSFSGAYLFGITILEMMPAVFHDADRTLGVFIIAGFLLQILLDQFSKGIEHGHMHAHDHVGKSYVWSVMIGLGLHSFLEGIPLTGLEHSHAHGSHLHHEHGSSPLLWGIAIHKIPAAFALMSILLTAKMRTVSAFAILIVFALISPLAAALTDLILHNGSFIHDSMSYILALVVGSFLHISTTILFEVNSKIHRFSLYKMLVILIGLMMALVTVV
jgi:zinc transporter ZupT